ncbi:MAG: PaaI family thioesterase [Cytophagales bacterium]|nr:PaaI family thioesterase [Cytophagales bacterium]
MNELSQDSEQRTRESVARQPLLKLYGVEVGALSRGYIELTASPRDFMRRTSGIVHGGVLAALADSAGGYALATMEDSPFLLTVEFKINFLRVAEGEQILAIGRVLKNGRTLAVAQADLYMTDAGEKKQVATALVTLIKKHNHGNQDS